MALQKQDGGIRPILCGEVWRRSFASLAVNATPTRNEAAKLFTSSYDNLIQTAGIRDGASHCAKILSVFYDNLVILDPDDPDVIIKIDVSNASNTTNRRTAGGPLKDVNIQSDYTPLMETGIS